MSVLAHPSPWLLCPRPVPTAQTPQGRPPAPDAHNLPLGLTATSMSTTHWKSSCSTRATPLGWVPRRLVGPRMPRNRRCYHPALPLAAPPSFAGHRRMAWCSPWQRLRPDVPCHHSLPPLEPPAAHPWTSTVPPVPTRQMALPELPAQVLHRPHRSPARALIQWRLDSMPTCVQALPRAAAVMA